MCDKCGCGERTPEEHAWPEKRRFPRVEEKLPLAYRTPPQVLESKACFTINISGGGVSFESEISFSPGDAVSVRIFKPVPDTINEGVAIHAIAEVRWLRQIDTTYRVGVEFVDIEDKDRTVIIRNVEEKLQ